MTSLAAPCDLGAPARYTSWRNGQDRAYERLNHSPHSKLVLGIPTGIGKSLIAVTYALEHGKRIAILTATRALQDQYMRDFAEVGMVDVRGMGNYPCPLLADWGHKGKTCKEGPCLDGDSCSYRESGCPYFDRVREAQDAPLAVVTNYDFWMTMVRQEKSLGAFDAIFMDEAHDVPTKLSEFLRIEISDVEMLGTSLHSLDPLDAWQQWAAEEVERIDARISKTLQRWSIRELKDYRKRVARLGEAKGDWITTRHRSGWSWTPKWPAPYAEEYLWRKIPKVVFMSATIRQKQLTYLGLQPRDYEFVEMPSPYQIGRRPVYHIPSVKLSVRSTESDLDTWINRIDQILEHRLDRKGIIHTVSYERAREIKKRSQYGDLMLIHDPEHTIATVEEFKASLPPAILCSPSVHTGVDFPYELAEYQIIAKVPFPDPRDPVVAARSAEDKEYGIIFALTQIVQAAGRGMRAPDDFCETFIVDDQARWLFRVYAEFLPRWFRESVKKVMGVPAPIRLEAA